MLLGKILRPGAGRGLSEREHSKHQLGTSLIGSTNKGSPYHRPRVGTMCSVGDGRKNVLDEAVCLTASTYRPVLIELWRWLLFWPPFQRPGSVLARYPKQAKRWLFLPPPCRGGGFPVDARPCSALLAPKDPAGRGRSFAETRGGSEAQTDLALPGISEAAAWGHISSAILPCYSW